MIQVVVYSNCCNKEAIAHCVDEGTCYYVCSACHMGTDVHEHRTKRENLIHKVIKRALKQFKETFIRLSKP